MVTLGIKLEDVEKEDLHFSRITTNPDNPYFQTGDISLAKRTNDWSDIKDGDFITIANDGTDKFDDFMLRVTFNDKSITLTPLSSFVTLKEKEVSYDKLSSVKLTGKILGAVRSLSSELKVDAFSVF